MQKDAIIFCRHVCAYSTLPADPVSLKHLRQPQSGQAAFVFVVSQKEMVSYLSSRKKIREI